MSDIEKQRNSITVSDQDRSSSVSYEGQTKKVGLFYVSSENKIQRKLQNRHVQLIAIGGTIGTAIFVSIGGGLIKAGPLGLFLSYTFWTFIMIILTTSVGEMVSFLPVPSPFITMAGRTVDEAMEFAAGWNFYLMESLYIPFEITAVNGMIHFWRDDYSPAITFCVQIALYAIINVFAVGLFGETEFWLSIGKLILLMGLLFFTFITMVGGNPQHDAFGFRNWNVEGGPLAEYLSEGASGHFQAIIAGLISAAFVCVGVEYMGMSAGECINPRKNMPIAFRTVLFRLVVFYIGGALSVGILVAYNDPAFVAKYSSSSDAAASPYVVAMTNMGIKGLPHIINAIMVTSAFSAGNSFVYCSSRVLYGLATQGFAPKFFSYCNKQGVPIFCIMASICFSLLSLLQLGNGAATVLNYIVSICTGSQVLNYVYMSITYIGFYRACKAQNIDRDGFAYKSWFQPYSSYFALAFLIIMVGILGYTTFLPGHWDVSSFIFYYIMVFVNIALIIFWKVLKRTKMVNPAEADLTSGLEEIEEHEYKFYALLNVTKETYQKPKWAKVLDWLF